MATRLSLAQESLEKEVMGSHMGGMGSVVVNTVVRMFTRKAVGKAMKSAKPASGKRKKAGPKKDSAKGKKDAW